MPRDRGALRRVVVRQDRGNGRGRRRAARMALRQPCCAGRRRDHVHADAERAWRDRMRLHGHAARVRSLPDRHRHGFRPARSRLDPAARSRRRLGHGDGRHVRVCLPRALGPEGARDPRTADDGSARLSVHAGARAGGRSRAVPRSSGHLRRRARLGALLPVGVRAQALGHDLGRRPSSTGSLRAATRQSTRFGSRRAIACGEPTSRRATRRTRRASASRSSSTRTSTGRRLCSRPASPSGGSPASRSPMRTPLRSAPSRSALRARLRGA